MGLSATGMGSGLDIQGIVKQLVDAEKKPRQTKISTQNTKLTSQISSWGTIKGSMDSLQKSLANLAKEETFSKHTLSNTGKDFFSAAAGDDASLGEFDIAVTQLAKQQKLTSSIVDSEKVEDVGSGELSITLGSGDDAKSFDVKIEPDSSLVEGDEGYGKVSLKQVVKAINSDPKNPGVSATIISDVNGAHLVISSDKTGVENQLEIKASDDSSDTLKSFAYSSSDDSLNTESIMSQTQAAQDASITIDGTMTATSSSNRFEDVIQGVDLTVLKESKDDDGNATSSKINIKEDHSNVKGLVEKFISAYNSFYKTAKAESRNDPKGDNDGPLSGDGMVRGAIQQVRSSLSTPIATDNPNLKTLGQLGITTKKDGTLELNSKVFDKAVKDNFSSVRSFFSGDNGFAKKMTGRLEAYTDKTTGSLKRITESLTHEKERLGDEQTALDAYMKKYEARVYKEYTNMDKMVGQLNNQFNFVTNFFSQSNSGKK